MWLRTSILAAIAVSLATGGYSIGSSKKVAVAEPSSSLGPEHPVTIALQEANLEPAQRAKLIEVSKQAGREKLQALRIAEAKGQQLQALALQKEAEISMLERRLEALSAELATQKKGKTNLKVVERQLKEARAIKDMATAASERVDTLLFEAIDQEATRKGVSLLDGPAKEQVFEIVATRRTLDANKDFALMTALDHRDMLGLTSAQTTKLQLLQADFIRLFAPLREQYENLSSEGDQGEITLDWITSKAGRVDFKEGQPIKMKLRGDGAMKVKGQDAVPKEWKAKPTVIKGKALKENEAAFEVKLDWVATKSGDSSQTRFVVVGKSTEGLAKLEGQLKALKSQFDLKAYSQLNPEQQRKLKALMN
jgi:hypothetical protein